MKTNQPNQPQGMPNVIYAYSTRTEKFGNWFEVPVQNLRQEQYIRFDLHEQLKSKHQEALDVLKELLKATKSLHASCKLSVCSAPIAIQTAEKILNEHEKH